MYYESRFDFDDRVGGGDGFASGFAYGFLTGKPPQECVNLGVAHGALLMSTRGDTSQITLDELLHTAAGGQSPAAECRYREDIRVSQRRGCNHRLDVGANESRRELRDGATMEHLPLDGA